MHANHRTFSITREPLGLPHGTIPPEHVASVYGDRVPHTLWTLGVDSCSLPERDVFWADWLARLAVGENLTCQSIGYRYSVEREA